MKAKPTPFLSQVKERTQASITSLILRSVVNYISIQRKMIFKLATMVTFLTSKSI